MQFLALSALALAVIGRSLAEPIPINAMHHDKLVSRVASNAPRFNELPANDPNAFWPCFRCAVECGAVVAGCGIVCAAAEIDGPLCGLCIAGAGGARACVECWPRCHAPPAPHDFVRRFAPSH